MLNKVNSSNYSLKNARVACVSQSVSKIKKGPDFLADNPENPGASPSNNMSLNEGNKSIDKYNPSVQ